MFSVAFGLPATNDFMRPEWLLGNMNKLGARSKRKNSGHGAACAILDAEICRARSAAPKSVSDDAEILVLTENGFRVRLIVAAT